MYINISFENLTSYFTFKILRIKNKYQVARENTAGRAFTLKTTNLG